MRTQIYSILWKILASPALALGILAGCSSLEREIDLDLPTYESRFVVEAYLEPGRPYTLLLTRSAAYFDPFPTTGSEFITDLLVQDAKVEITYRGRTIRLDNSLGIIPGTGKLYNYASPEIIPQDFERPFYLEITTEAGDTLQASTQLLRPVPIDSVVVEFKDQDTLARVLTYLTDPPETANFYRRMLHKGNLRENPEQDFPADDRIVENVLVFGSGYDYVNGDTLINTIYHIDETYFDFLETLRSARDANGNPFAQPSPVVSQINGNTDAIGIFTGLSYNRVTTYINR